MRPSHSLFVILPLALVTACQKSAANEPVSATPTPSALASTTPVAGEPGKSCLMVNVCSCNLGCASVPLSKSQVKVGAKTRVTKGALEGKDVQVIETVDATGTRVLALSDREPNHPCSLGIERSGLAYLCETSKSGPVPAKACANGCD
jgi:hypothetical protein